MDVRNCCGQALDVPAAGLYGWEPGVSARDAAGKYADVLDRDVLVSLLLQPDRYEAADDEATQALADLLVLAGHLEPAEAKPAGKPRSPKTD